MGWEVSGTKWEEDRVPASLEKGKVTKVGLIDKSERKGKREEDNGQWIKPTRHCPAFLFDPRK